MSYNNLKYIYAFKQAYNRNNMIFVFYICKPDQKID